MKLIALTGIVGYEQTHIANEMQTAFIKHGYTVEMGSEPILAYESDADMVLLNIPQSIHPEAVFNALESIRSNISDIDITMVALIDLRTCDCFPHLREMLESIADVIVNLPADGASIVEDLL